MNETLPGTFFCNKCGTLNTVGAQFCSQCGAPTSPAAGAIPTPDAMAGPPLAPATANPYPPVPAYPGAMPYPAAVPRAGVGYGGFWIRVLAAIIDAIIVRVVVIPFGAIFGGMSLLPGLAGGTPNLGMMLFGAGITLVFVLVGGWLYEAFLESSSYQATLGKMIFGMKVTDLNGNRISFARATGRHFAKILSGMVLCIGFIMVGFTERKQGLHDLLAGTLVRRS
jgi:uncharacterized RDD family membrane protein YckC